MAVAVPVAVAVAVTAAGEALARLRSRLDGQLVLPADEDYDRARRVWNGSIDKRPAAVARVASEADVARCVEVAGEQGLPLAVRGGGHNAAGFGTCNGGIVVDLCRWRAVGVDPEQRVARVQGGATWADFDGAAHAHGLATTGGQISTTGVGGLTLGGGIGWLVRKHGLTCDNLLAAELVTADGTTVRASATENEELFWGVRGGGGNFGVATSFEFRVHPVGTVLAGMVLHPISRVREVIRFFAEWVPGLPDEVSVVLGTGTLPPGSESPPELVGRPMVGIGACWAGPVEEGERVLRPLREFGPPAADQIGLMPYPQLQSMLDAGAPAGLQNYVKAGYLAEIDDKVVEAVAAASEGMLSPLSQVYLVQLGGAMSRVPAGATAFGHRRAPFVTNILSIWTAEEASRPHTRWARNLWKALQPASTGGVYVNFLGDEGSEGVRSAYEPTAYERLVALKDRYDPGNLFRLNQNIRPTGAAGASRRPA